MYRNTRIRLKLFLIALIIPSVLNGGQITAAEVYEQWRMEMPGFIEPPMEYMIGWNLNEVPGNATVYYDLNGDKVPELGKQRARLQRRSEDRRAVPHALDNLPRRLCRRLFYY